MTLRERLDFPRNLLYVILYSFQDFLRGGFPEWHLSPFLVLKIVNEHGDLYGVLSLGSFLD